MVSSSTARRLFILCLPHTPRCMGNAMIPLPQLAFSLSMAMLCPLIIPLLWMATCLLAGIGVWRSMGRGYRTHRVFGAGGDNNTGGGDHNGIGRYDDRTRTYSYWAIFGSSDGFFEECWWPDQSGSGLELRILCNFYNNVVNSAGHCFTWSRIVNGKICFE